jgi:Ca-activated chloride channel homolog
MKAAIGITLFVCIFIAPLRADAESAGSLVIQGNEFYATGEYDKALANYEKALTEQPDSGEIFFNKGNALFQKGEYDKAREAYQVAALHTKDLSLEASAHYNLGNTIFAEGQKQLESDPRKTLAQWEQSIRHYQEALRIDPQIKDAGQNIEVVRLSMKDLADRIKKAEEAAKEQQKQREEMQRELDEVVREQESEINQNDALQEKAAQTSSESISKQAQQLASEQEKTREKTGKVTEKLKELRAQSPKPPQQSESPTPAAEEHLEKAREAQRSAVEKLEKNELGEARKDQEEALEHIKEALNDPDGSKNNQGQCPNPQAGDQGEKGDAKDKEQEKRTPEDQSTEEMQKDAKSAQQQATEGTPQLGQKEGREDDDAGKAGTTFSESPESILREEKENRLQLHRVPQGAYKPVEKDW